MEDYKTTWTRNKDYSAYFLVKNFKISTYFIIAFIIAFSNGK